MNKKEEPYRKMSMEYREHVYKRIHANGQLNWRGKIFTLQYSGKDTHTYIHLIF